MSAKLKRKKSVKGVFTMKMSRAEKNEVLLKTYTTEWCSLEIEKRTYYRQKGMENDLSSTTIQTLYIIQERIDFLVSQIVKKVDWFRRNDEDFDNEIACQVYDQYAEQLHRGITSLIDNSVL